MSNTGPAPGEFETEWRPTKPENPGFLCTSCGSDDVYYRRWESSDGGYEDIKYECRACKHTWWVEGDDG